MNPIRRFFGPKNSLVIFFDEIDPDAIEAEVADIRKYYELCSVKNIAFAITKRKAMGLAALCFREPRKETFKFAIPRLLENEVPFTVFIQPNRVGVTRLPSIEEVELFHKKHPEKIPVEKVKALGKVAWQKPLEIEAILKNWRRDFGPLPIELMDPLRLFVTWGELHRLPPQLVELGFYLFAEPNENNLPMLQEEITFARTQMRREIEIAYHPVIGKGSIGALQSLGLVSIVGSHEGEATLRDSPMALPHWKLHSQTKETP